MRFEMSAYGEYVWSAYIAATILFITLPILAKMQRRKIVKMIKGNSKNASHT